MLHDKLILIFCILLSHAVLGGETQPYDQKLDQLDSLTKVNFTEAEKLAIDIIEKSEKEGKLEVEQKALASLIQIYLIKGRITVGDSILNRLYITLDTTYANEAWAEYVHLKATAANIRGRYEEALNLFQQSYELNEALSREIPKMKAYANIGSILMQQKEYNMALPYLKEASRIAWKKEDLDSYAAIRINRSIVLKHLGDTAGAYEDLVQIQPYVENSNLHVRFAYHSNRVEVCNVYEDNECLLSHASAMMDIAEQMNSPIKTAFAKTAVATYYMKKGEDDVAIQYYEESLDAYKGQGDRLRLKNIYDGLHELYARQGAYKKAYSYYQKAHDLGLKLINEKRQESILKLERDFAVQQEKAKTLQKELALQSTRNKLHNRTLWWYGTLAALISALIIIYLASVNQRRKEELFEKEKEKNQLQKEIDLYHQYQTGQEHERRRISKELHDGIGGLLVAARMHLHDLQANEGGNKAYSIIDKAYAEARTLSHKLAPWKLEEQGLVDAMKYYIRLIEYEELNIEFQAGENVNNWPKELSIFMYRCCQEFITNAIKHGKAKNITITFDDDGQQAWLKVRDDGKGMQDYNAHEMHSGLYHIKRQAELIKGNLTISSEKAKHGTHVKLLIPIN